MSITKNLLILFTTLTFFYIINFYKKTPDNPNPVKNFDFQPRVNVQIEGDNSTVYMKNLNCLNGLTKCKNCDCFVVCASNDFEKTYIEGEVIVSGKKLDEGEFYCLAKKKPFCDPKFTRSVFTTTGWRCLDKFPSLIHQGQVVACATKDGSRLNPLWDYKLNKKIKDTNSFIGETFDPTELLSDGVTPRYGCKCIYRDDFGNETKYIPSIDHLTCFEDYCLKNNSQSGLIGYKNDECECDPLFKRANGTCTACRDLKTVDAETHRVTKQFIIDCYGLDSTIDQLSKPPCPTEYFYDSKQLCYETEYTHFNDFKYKNLLKI